MTTRRGAAPRNTIFKWPPPSVGLCRHWLAAYLENGELDDRLRALGFKGGNGEAITRTAGPTNEVTVILLW